MISHLFITFYTTIASALERTSNFVCTFFSEPIFYYSISWGSSCIGEGSRFGPRHPAPNLSNRQMLDMGFSLLSVSHKRKTSSNGPTFPHLGSTMAFRLMLFIAWVHSMIVTSFPEIPSYDLVPTKPIWPNTLVTYHSQLMKALMSDHCCKKSPKK